MVSGLQQEEVVRHLFSLYVTPEVAEHAIQYGAELGGQLTSASVLFSDIRGFTSLTESLAPDTLIALLNRYFQAMSAVIARRGGLVNKFGGDSLLAVFGTPLNPDPDHAWSAVQAAQAMQAALEQFNTDQARRGEPQLRIGIGVASGPVVAGNVGSQERLEYTVIGDTVNLASRLQSMTKELGVSTLLSEFTAQAVQGKVSLEAIGRVAVRGKQEPVEVFRLG
jgi:adenylate cyclase